MAAQNPWRAKTNRAYTINEVALLYKVTRQTVRNWVSAGLKVCDNSKPILVRGADLRDFLESRRQRKRRPCQPGQIYCVGCREVRQPKDDRAILELSPTGRATIRGQCPVCDSRIFRRVSLGKESAWIGSLEVISTKREGGLTGCELSFSNCSLTNEVRP